MRGAFSLRAGMPIHLVHVRAWALTRLRRASLATALAVAGVLSLTPAPAQAVDTNAEWIHALVMPDGAIARDIQPWMDGYPTYISPYWALLGTHGLLRSGVASDQEVVWDFLAWYRDNMSPAGHVRNYEIVWDMGASPPTYTLDPDPMNEWFSTVGNAGMFLVVLRDAYWFAGNDVSKLEPYRVAIQKAVSAIQATLDADGLAWQNPRVKTKLLMDQAQAYAGLRRGAMIANALGDSATAKLAGKLADQIQDGVASMWRASAQLYAKSKDENGNLAATTWNQYYMDSTAQAWLVAFGNIPPAKPLINASRAKDLVDAFEAAWPEWTDPYYTVPDGDPRVTGTGDGAIDYWPMIALAFFDVQRKADGVAGVDAIEQAAVDAGRTWPFTVGHAGEIIRVRGA